MKSTNTLNSNSLIVDKKRKSTFKGRLGTKLTIIISICLFLIISVSVSVVFTSLSSLVKNTYTAEVEHSLSALSQEVESYRQTIESATVAMATDSTLIAAAVNDDRTTISKKLTEYQQLGKASFVVVTDAQGVIITCTDITKNNSNYSDVPEIASAISGTTSTIIGSNKLAPFSVISSAPIYTATGTIKGAIMMCYSLTNPEIVDNLKKTTGNEFTIFNGDTRVNTTLMENDQRYLNTQVAQTISNQVLNQNKAYLGEAELFGVKHLCAYDPLIDNNGNVIGMLFTGKDISSIKSSETMSLLISIIIAVVLFAFSTLILYTVIQRIISKPLKKLVLLAADMEKGEIGVGINSSAEVTINSNDEVGELSATLAGTVLSLKTYIGEISHILSEISHGNLMVHTDVKYTGDFIEIKSALDNIILSLKHTFVDINRAASQVASGSQQVAMGAQALSEGSSQQTSSIEELSATIIDISEKIRTNAEHANLARKFASEAGDGVTISNKQMKEMLLAMNEINKSSSQISKIIKTIDDIAFQTNILALNAAVEAARAGTAGKGFAVVADEVRSLAGKSAEAANQTTALIQNSIQAVNNGSKIADETAKSLNMVVEKSAKVVELIGQITSESNSQADAVTDVTNGVEQISAVVQTNSATAQESAAASEQLSSQSHLMHELVSKFNIGKI